MRAISVVLLAACLLLAGVQSAVGLGGVPLLGFAEEYTAPDGSSCTHRGIDIAFQSGESVEAPVAGRVKFAGRVPGPHGGSILAVTLETLEGVVTLLPFEDLDVESGAEVDAGEVIGTVAASGDPSSGEAHIHMGLKRGGVYVDPSVLLAAVPAPCTSDQPPAVEPAPAETAPEAAAPAEAAPAPAKPAADGVTAAPRAGTATQPSPVQSPESAGVLASFGDGLSSASQSGVRLAPTSEADSAGTVISPGVALAPSSTRAQRPGLAQPHSPVAGPPAARAAADAAAGAIELPALAKGALGWGFGVLAAAVFAGALLVTRKVLTRRIAGKGPMSDRLGTLLQHLKAGDTLCGLTSCSGPLPSQSRGH